MSYIILALVFGALGGSVVSIPTLVMFWVEMRHRNKGGL